MSWNNEREETLREMWLAGKTAGQIANTLGGVTRCGVIGKVHRLGIGRARQVAPIRKAIRNGRQRSAPAPQRKPVVAVKPIQRPAAPMIERVAPAIPTGPGIRIMELIEGRCKWPLGGFHDPVEFYCGASQREEGGSYCPHHHGIAHTYTPARVSIKPRPRDGGGIRLLAAE